MFQCLKKKVESCINTEVNVSLEGSCEHGNEFSVTMISVRRGCMDESHAIL
jgi:hypothetical protein